MPLAQPPAKPCLCADLCTGACTGYATRSNCPPLIVLAVAAIAAAKLGGSPAALHSRFAPESPAY